MYSALNEMRVDTLGRHVLIDTVVLEREFNLRYWGRSVSFQVVRRWLRGEVVPTQDRLQVLAEWLGVDAHWLRFGERLTLTVQEKPA